MLGLGSENVELVPVDDQGRMRTDQMPKLDEAALVITQAGNVNSGAIDPIGQICQHAHASGSWVHVDGAFGLWARALPSMRKTCDGIEWPTPGRSTHTRPSMFPTTAASFSAGIAKP